MRIERELNCDQAAASQLLYVVTKIKHITRQNNCRHQHQLSHMTGQCFTQLNLVQGWSPMTSAHSGADIVAVLVDLGGNVKLNDRYKVRLSNCSLIFFSLCF